MPTDPVEFVRYYNAWRVGGDMDQPEPSTITRMLTELCDLAEQREKQLADAKAALAACREDSAELLAERGWWKDEPRAGYQRRYQETVENIVVADSILSPQ